MMARKVSRHDDHHFSRFPAPSMTHYYKSCDQSIRGCVCSAVASWRENSPPVMTRFPSTVTCKLKKKTPRSGATPCVSYIQGPGVG